MRCQSCKTPFVSSFKDKTKVYNKLLIFKGEQGFVVCKKCGNETMVPIRLEKSYLDDHAKKMEKPPEIFVVKTRDKPRHS